MPDPLSPEHRVSVLAEMMLQAKPGAPSRFVFFLGAGAPRSAGLPLADELKDRVAKTVFGSDIPDQIDDGRLEDVMELFQSMAGQDGYELVAREVRGFHDQPKGYPLLGDLAHRGFVEAIVTTNFDLLLDELPLARPVNFTILSSDEDHVSRTVPRGTTLVSKIHGSAGEPKTMRGSWTDGRSALPLERAKLLKNLLGRCPTVFIGWAGRDKDVVRVISEIPSFNAPKIFWVDPASSPSDEISAILQKFGSANNYIRLTADEFIENLHEKVTGPTAPHSDLSTYRSVANRIARSPLIYSAEARQEARRSREQYRHKVDARVMNALARIKIELGRQNDDRWSVTASEFNFDGADVGQWHDEVSRLCRGRQQSVHKALEIRAGGPALRLFVGQYYEERGTHIELTAVLAFYKLSKETTGTPLPPLAVWGASKFDVEWGSEASFRELEQWLDHVAAGLLVGGLALFDDILAGRRSAPN